MQGKWNWWEERADGKDEEEACGECCLKYLLSFGETEWLFTHNKRKSSLLKFSDVVQASFEKRILLLRTSDYSFKTKKVKFYNFILYSALASQPKINKSVFLWKCPYV